MESPPQDPPRHRILGLPVHATDIDEVVDRATRTVRNRRSLHVVVTNSHKCWLAHRDPALRAVMESADLVVPETSVVWAARLLGHRGVRPCWGVALAPRLLAAADERGWSIFLLGARPDVVEAVAGHVRRRYPGASLLGWSHGYLEPDGEERVADRLVREAPDLLLVAMGSPRQERFMGRLPRDRGPAVVVGVGGTFDVLAGRTRDAPSFVRGSGFEWLYRALQSPRLFRRYAAVKPWFVSRVLVERLTGRPPGFRP